MPPTGSTRPRRLISPVIAVSLRTVRSVMQRDQRHEHRDAGARAVLRDRARRHVDVDVALLEQRRVDAELGGAALDQLQRRLRALRITSPSWPVRISPPLAGHARRLDEQDVAADRRPGEPGRDAGHAGAHRDLALELRRARGSRARSSASIVIGSALPSAIRTAAWRSALPISRSRLRTPASRV